MKFCLVTTLAALAATGASAFAPVATTTQSTTALSSAQNIWSTMGSLEGPSLCWGPEGPAIGKEDTEFKEYDNFTMFRSALDQCGLKDTLRGVGPYTLLAPTDSAVQAFTGMLDEETLKYHIILGDVYSDETEGQRETLSGHYVTCRSEFRKHYIDDSK